jgi:hypothetical protein
MMVGAIIAGGIGLAGVVVGGVTGGLVFSKKGDVDAECVELVCTPAGKDAVDDAQTLGLVSTVSFIVGGAGVATAALLFFLAPDADEPAVGSAARPMRLNLGAGPDGASIGLSGSF